jgi:hypothetical protein
MDKSSGQGTLFTAVWFLKSNYAELKSNKKKTYIQKFIFLVRKVFGAIINYTVFEKYHLHSPDIKITNPAREIL